MREALRDLPDAVFADLLERDDAYLLVIDLPGVTAETVEATVEGNRLRIEARRAKDVPHEFRYHSEDRSLFLDIDLPIPPDATAQNAEAEMERGCSNSACPRSPRPKRRRSRSTSGRSEVSPR